MASVLAGHAPYSVQCLVRDVCVCGGAGAHLDADFAAAWAPRRTVLPGAGQSGGHPVCEAVCVAAGGVAAALRDAMPGNLRGGIWVRPDPDQPDGSSLLLYDRQQRLER